jgi:hypothetical protein
MPVSESCADQSVLLSHIVSPFTPSVNAWERVLQIFWVQNAVPSRLYLGLLYFHPYFECQS